METPVKFMLVLVSVPVLSKQNVFTLPAALMSFGFRHSIFIPLSLFEAKEIPISKQRGRPGGKLMNMMSAPENMI